MSFLPPSPFRFARTSTNQFRSARPARKRSALAVVVMLLGVWSAVGPMSREPRAFAATTAGFKLSVTPSTATASPGGRATYTIRITRTRFTTPVKISISGVPSGSAVRASANPINNSATMAVIVPDTAKAGRYRITVRGVAGKLSRSATATLNIAADAGADVAIDGSSGATGGAVAGLPTTKPLAVTTTVPQTPSPTVATPTTVAAPATATTTTSVSTTTTATQDFTMSVSPATQQIGAGGVATYNISINRTGGFSQALDFAVTGLPAGVGFAFAPNPVTGNSTTLSIITTESAAQGTFALQVVTRFRVAPITLVIGSFVASTTSTSLPLATNGSTQTVAAGTTQTVGLAIPRASAAIDPAVLSAVNVPSGVTVTFAPNPATTTSTMSIAVGAAVAPGSYAYFIVGAPTGLVAPMTLTLVVTAASTASTTTSSTVAPGTFVMSASPASQTVVAGGAAVYNLDFQSPPGAVSLGVGGLPGSASAVFGANPATGATTMTVTTPAGTPNGTYPLNISGVASGQARNVTVALVVGTGSSAPFAIAAVPGTISLARGGTAGQVAINLTRQAGFTGEVTFTVIGNPGTMTVAFTSTTVNGTSLVVAPQAGAATGNVTLTVTGSNGALAASIQIVVTVT